MHSLCFEFIQMNWESTTKKNVRKSSFANVSKAFLIILLNANARTNDNSIKLIKTVSVDLKKKPTSEQEKERGTEQTRQNLTKLSNN